MPIVNFIHKVNLYTKWIESNDRSYDSVFDLCQIFWSSLLFNLWPVLLNRERKILSSLCLFMKIAHLSEIYLYKLAPACDSRRWMIPCNKNKSVSLSHICTIDRTIHTYVRLTNKYIKRMYKIINKNGPKFQNNHFTLRSLQTTLKHQRDNNKKKYNFSSTSRFRSQIILKNRTK